MRTAWGSLQSPGKVTVGHQGCALRTLTATISCFLGSMTLTFLSLDAVQMRLPLRLQLTL